MTDSSDIRRHNILRILDMLWRSGTYTKHQIAAETGLSQATCNTLLNVLHEQNAVLEKKARQSTVGRSVSEYTFNETYKPFLTVRFDMIRQKIHLQICLCALNGKILSRSGGIYDHLHLETLMDHIQRALDQYAGISMLVIGTPSMVDHGILRFCDIPELENAPLAEAIRSITDIPYIIENDMTYKALGYAGRNREKVTTLAYFPSGVRPAATTIQRGTIISGAHGFAGMIGFLPDTSVFGYESIIQNLVSTIVLLDPDVLVLSGDRIKPADIGTIRSQCSQYIPEAYMPRFEYMEDLDDFYEAGMLEKARHSKGAWNDRN